jgi:hypothetical protein
MPNTGLENIFENVKKLTAKSVMIGIPEEKDTRTDSTVSNTSIGNATLGYLHEFGAPTINLPPRPSLIPGVEAVQSQIVKRLSDAAAKVTSPDFDTSLDKNLNATGMIAVSSVKNVIQQGNFVPLSPRTIAERLRRRPGKTATAEDIKILIDTAQFLNSHTYVIKEN